MTEKNSRMGMTPQMALEVYPSGSKLRKIRASKGMSQQDLASASGVTKRAIQCYEQSERNIDHARLTNLCDLSLALGVKIEELLEDEELIKKFKKCK